MLDAKQSLSPSFDEPARRSGERRRRNVAVERDNRSGDRRENKPGLSALLGAIFSR
jgi:hypothetical protein